jgi:deoxycytidylate deaminase
MRINKESIYQLIQTNCSMKSLFMKSLLRNIHIAIVVKRGKVMEMATNHLGSRSRGCGYTDRTIHAERAVLKKVGDHTKLDGAILIVIRISRGTNEVVNSTPCHACTCHLEKCVKDYGLRRVYYSA